MQTWGQAVGDRVYKVLGFRSLDETVQRRTIAMAFERVNAGVHREARQPDARNLLKLDENERNQETEGSRILQRIRDLCWVGATSPSIALSSGSSPAKKLPDGRRNDNSTTGTRMDSSVFVDHSEHNGCRGLGVSSDIRWCEDGVQMKDSGARGQPCEPCQKGRFRGRDRTVELRPRPERASSSAGPVPCFQRRMISHDRRC